MRKCGFFHVWHITVGSATPAYKLTGYNCILNMFSFIGHKKNTFWNSFNEYITKISLFSRNNLFYNWPRPYGWL